MELTWENANAWQDKVNDKKEIHDEPKWRWDCGFKLDFDGSLLSISSRFYPPHKNDGSWWEGTLHIILLGEPILTKNFKEETLEVLHASVEKYVKQYVGCIKPQIK
jgi:hypothetical protein